MLLVQDNQLRHQVCSVDTRVTGHIPIAQRYDGAQLGESRLRNDAICIPGDRLACCVEHVKKCWIEDSAFVESMPVFVYILICSNHRYVSKMQVITGQVQN